MQATNFIQPFVISGTVDITQLIAGSQHIYFHCSTVSLKKISTMSKIPMFQY